MDHSSTGSGNRAEAERWLEISGRLLRARDLVGCKRFAERAMEVEPLLTGVDEILAVADVLLSSQRRFNNHPDWYSILQLPSSLPHDPSAVKSSYRRLALLLHPDQNRLPGADHAFQLVSDAWAFLSDSTKKNLYDDEIRISTAHLQSNGSPVEPLDAEEPPVRTPSPPPPPPPFWTMCPSCFRAHEYDRVHLGRTLRCPCCRKPFVATELPSPPPIVPGTDSYYCSWGLFPIGFPGCPPFSGIPLPDTVMRSDPFLQIHPQAPPPPPKGGGDQTRERIPMPSTSPNPQPVPKLHKKSLAQKAKKSTGRPRGRPRKDLGVPSGTKNVANVTDGVGDIAAGFDMNTFSIDLDSTAEVLGNLAHLPFMRDDEVGMMR